MRIRHLQITACFLWLVITPVMLKAQTIVLLHQHPGVSFRGLSVVNNKTAWVSGSKGTVGITADGGKTWAWQQVKGFEQSDFRDIEAFSAREAIIMSSGTPALILKTNNGGITWQVNYRNDDKAYFLDGMDFTDNRHGLVMGDPVNRNFLLLETTDGGNHWHRASKQPAALPGEAAFAASGTCIRAAPGNNRFYIVTGGSTARLLTKLTAADTATWHSMPVPIAHGEDSKGIFSIAIGRKAMIMAGGDYKHNLVADSNMCCFNTGRSGSTGISKVMVPPSGFQSCVEYLNHDTFLSTGTPGSNLTSNGGKNWQMIDAMSYNVCKKAKHGSLVLLAGDGGKIGLYRP